MAFFFLWFLVFYMGLVTILYIIHILSQSCSKKNNATIIPIHTYTRTHTHIAQPHLLVIFLCFARDIVFVGDGCVVLLLRFVYANTFEWYAGRLCKIACIFCCVVSLLPTLSLHSSQIKANDFYNLNAIDIVAFVSSFFIIPSPFKHMPMHYVPVQIEAVSR